jgi:cation diffusion facilitator CzcD-associated flavoprotein CzcO
MTYDLGRAPANGSDTALHDVRVAIIGAGFGGIGAAIKLREAGIEDFVVLERDPAIGGTWWANTYPGCACDVPAHLYSYSFALNPKWSTAFAPQPEILEYIERVAKEYGVDRSVRCGTELQAAEWDEERQRWKLQTNHGSFNAQVIIAATGGLCEPRYPDIPGLDSFEGTSFHTARWNHDHDLRGKRVAMIGTGASAAQVIPRIQPDVEHLTVFQRTPGWVLPRGNSPHTKFTQRLFERYPAVQRALRNGLYYGAEGLVVGLVHEQRLLKGIERLARWNLKRQVPDPAIRAKLTPDFTFGCKRIMFSQEYLPTYMEPNVDLVSDGIREIVSDGIISNDGRHHAVDTIVFGTGFKPFQPPHADHVVGRDGRTLREVWDEGGIRAHLGTSVAGFPNHFLLVGPNTGLGNNSIINIIEFQLAYIVDALKTMDLRGASSVDVRPDVMERYNAEIQARLQPTVWNQGGCSSWYLGPDGTNFTLWPSFSDAFKRRTARFDAGEYELQTAGAEASAPAAP